METKEFKSFYKEVKGNEGTKCHYPTRLDTYGCGCPFNCNYCYARSLLEFRKLWNPTNPSEADIEKIRRKIRRLPEGTPAIRLGGMTDCFQPKERKTHLTLETIKALNEHRQAYLIVTKSNLVSEEPWLAILDPELAHVQVTITCFDDANTGNSTTRPLLSRPNESKPSNDSIRRESTYRCDCPRSSPSLWTTTVSPPSTATNYWSSFCASTRKSRKSSPLWTSPHIRSNRADTIISPWSRKKKLMDNIYGFKEVTVCEDESEAYEYWNHHYNPNPADCCNLRRTSVPPLGAGTVGRFRKTR